MTELAATITRIYQEDLASGRKAIALGDVPITYESITPEWLTQILCRDVPGAAVVSFEQGERNDGSSNRRRLYLTYNEAGRNAGLPATVFCKMAESLKNRLMIGMSGATKGETDFYNKVRGRAGIETPVPLHAHFDPHSYAYILVMKDFAGEVTVCDENTAVDWTMAVSQIELLAKLHATFYEHPDLGTEALPFRRWPRWWAEQMAHAPDFGSSCDRGFVDSEHVMPARLFRRRAEIWPCTAKSVERQNHLPHTVTHSDVHLKNWYVTPDRRMGLTDWHCIAIGHWSRDFIYAISTALTVENRRAWGTELLRIYLDKLAEHGVPPVSFDEALLNCRQQIFTALAFWTITLRPAKDMPVMQFESTTYTFLERLTHAIDDLDAVDSFE